MSTRATRSGEPAINNTPLFDLVFKFNPNLTS